MKMIATSLCAIVRVGTAERAVCVVPQPSRGERPGATRGLRRMHRDEYSPVQSSTVQYRPARESSTVQSSPVSSSLLSMMVSATNLPTNEFKASSAFRLRAVRPVYVECAAECPVLFRSPRRRARARALSFYAERRGRLCFISRGGAGPGSAAPPVPVVHRRATRVRAPMKYRPYRPDHVAQQAKVDTAPGYFNLFNTWLAPRQPQHAWTSITKRPSRRRAASCRRRQSRKASDVKEPARGHPAWSSAGADSARRQAGCCHRHYRS